MTQTINVQVEGIGDVPTQLTPFRTNREDFNEYVTPEGIHVHARLAMEAIRIARLPDGTIARNPDGSPAIAVTTRTILIITNDAK